MATCPTCRLSYDDGLSVCPDDGDTLLPDEAFANVDDELPPGTDVGEYCIIEKIGAGSYGDVYAAEHPLIGKRAAVKVLHRRLSAEPQIVSRFISEARAVNKIRHRNIIDIFSFGRLDSGQQYFIMELLEGEALGDMLARRGCLPVEETLVILKGVADALDAAHAEGVAHRDLKPDNIFVAKERDGTVIPKLLDFGVAKLMGDETVKHKTATGMAVGTPLYMSPEQCRNKKVDHRADIYAFGVVVFQLLTGKVPFDGESAIDVLYKHMSEPPPDMSSVADVPPELDAPVRIMLAKRPADRQGSVGEAYNGLVDAAVAAGYDLRASSQLPQSDFSANLIEPAPSTVLDSERDEASTRRVPSALGVGRSRDGLSAAAGQSGDVRMDDLALVGSAETVALPSESNPGLLVPTDRTPTDSSRGEANADSAGDAEGTFSSTMPEAGLGDGASGAVISKASTVETLSAVSSGAEESSGSGLWKVAAAAVVLAAGVGGYMALHDDGVAATAESASMSVGDGGEREGGVAKVAGGGTASVGPAAAAPDGTGEDHSDSDGAAAATTVKVTITSQPVDAEVWLGDERLGTTGTSFELSRGDEAVELTVKKAGHREQRISVTPAADVTEAVSLPPLGRPAPQPPKAAPKAAPKPPTSPAPKPAPPQVNLDDR